MKKLPTILSAFAVLAVGGFSADAAADQCAWVTQEQAKMAVSLIPIGNGERLGHLCEPCGETPTELGGPRYPEETNSVSIVAHKTDFGGEEKTYYEVLVNDEVIDLAYTYLPRAVDPSNDLSPVRHINLALVVKCPAHGVTPLFVTGE